MSYRGKEQRAKGEGRRVKFFSSIPNKTFPYQKYLLPFAENLLRSEGKFAGVNVVLLSDEEQRALNRDFRKLDKVTDVLSFEWNEIFLESGENFLGEIYIAQGQVKRQAPQYGSTYYRELKRVLIHGLLHLCGYDHCEKHTRKRMREKEEEYLQCRGDFLSSPLASPAGVSCKGGALQLC